MIKNSLRFLLILNGLIIIQTTACNPIADPGKDLYAKHCENCHGKDGKGLRGVIPPLQATEYLTENRDQLVCNIIYGMEGKITVNGKEYEAKMTANPHLSNADVSNILNYIQESFNEGLKPFTLKEVEAFRENCPIPK